MMPLTSCMMIVTKSVFVRSCHLWAFPLTPLSLWRWYNLLRPLWLQLDFLYCCLKFPIRWRRASCGLVLHFSAENAVYTMRLARVINFGDCYCSVDYSTACQLIFYLIRLGSAVFTADIMAVYWVASYHVLDHQLNSTIIIPDWRGTASWTCCLQCSTILWSGNSFVYDPSWLFRRDESLQCTYEKPLALYHKNYPGEEPEEARPDSSRWVRCRQKWSRIKGW